MNPEQQQQPIQPTSMTGSNWQRQALTAARAGAAAAKHSDASSPTIEAARQRAAAQQVPDMLAAADPAPEESVQPAQQQPQPAGQDVSADESVGKPVVSGALAADDPAAGAPVVGTGGPSVGKKIAIFLLVLVVIIGAAGAGFLLVG